MRRYALALSAGAVFSLALVPAALASPVKSKDLVGKKICWDVGSASTYAADGKYTNDFTGDGTWSIAADGVHIHTDQFDYVATVDKMPDGTFHVEIPVANIKVVGKYCK